MKKLVISSGELASFFHSLFDAFQAANVLSFNVPTCRVCCLSARFENWVFDFSTAKLFKFSNVAYESKFADY